MLFMLFMFVVRLFADDGPLAKFDVTAGLKQGRPAEKNGMIVL